ncbi:AAA family ATPase [Rhodocyclus tenuis]|uniref:AAA family ATPase n=1 Tax=Rhodocyclus gracilis TaxID=2929842 RepID=A0ABX0WD69_9RHOO|nr:AAA family ATPase [Rhodocyclus gracilis]MRD73310.1 AAA family ATPase [Rhodocyclus gracilis]NJA87689.1 AAA family ATPase [Rhodocyclus gracilis]
MTEQKTQWPSHYTSADVALIETIQKWIADRSYTQAALARLARISSSSLNQILKGVYVTSPTKLLSAVSSATRHADETSGHAVAPVETSVFRLANIACDMARRYRNFAVLSAFVGTGKTFAVKHYAATHPNTYIIEATPTMTPQSLTKLLARMVVGLEKGSIADKFDQVVASLRNTDSLIIVDEAETLTPHQLHTIRRIRDLANIGIVLCGTEHLSGLIKPQHGQFDQIRSRTGFWPETVRHITDADAAALVQSAFGSEEVAEEVIARLYAYCKGSARMLVEGLIAGIKEFRRGRALDVKLVDAVAKQALCLQSVA